jgi:predicted amidophosphoribosyltransferase
MFLNTILGNILDLVFPAKCLSCGKSGSDLCPVCLSDAGAAERETADWIFPLYDYRHPLIKKSLWLLKYSGKKRLVNVFAENIYDKIIEELSEMSLLQNFTAPILIPIPLSSKRYHERGFNQAELICEELVRISKRNHLTPNPSPKTFFGEGCPEFTEGRGEVLTLAKNILIKIKETEHQARIKDRSVRLKNLVGSFAIKNEARNSEFLKGKNIILIDDITTTGATLNEARKILRQIGARKVIAFTVAH